MKKLAIASLLFCASLVVINPAHAKKQNNNNSDNIDFGSYTCGQFLKEAASGDEDDIGVVLMWIDGYLSGVSGDTVWKPSEFVRFSERLANYCASRPNMNLLEAAKSKGIQH
ncbi:MAG: HdeA family protein [Magnetococcus sp. YQC-9]